MVYDAWCPMIGRSPLTKISCISNECRDGIMMYYEYIKSYIMGTPLVFLIMFGMSKRSFHGIIWYLLL